MKLTPQQLQQFDGEAIFSSRAYSRRKRSRS